MEPYLKTRPSKTPFPILEQERLRALAINKIKNTFLPNDGVRKIILIGSSVKDTFGEYQPPGFRGSLFSDFDFIVFVANDYQIPADLEREVSAKPFPADTLNLAYRVKKFVENTFDAKIFFVREHSLSDIDFRNTAEAEGIPLVDESGHPKLIVYE